jgi:hypothetical protein
MPANIRSNRTHSSPEEMMVPSPTLEPISSAANSTTNAWARPMRTPENSCGAAAGMITRKKIFRSGVPMFCAVQTSSLLTESTAWRDAMNTGKKPENAMIAILDA